MQEDQTDNLNNTSSHIPLERSELKLVVKRERKKKKKK